MPRDSARRAHFRQARGLPGREIGRIANDRAVSAILSAAANANARFVAVTSAWCNADRSGDDAYKDSEGQHAADLKAGETLFDRRTIASQE